jgi:putative ABC transport system permease protein
MNEFARDIKYAIRDLIRKPAFSAIIVATLALGIGGNTAILIAAHTVLFSNLPFHHSEELTRIQATTTGPAGDQNAFNLRGGEIQELWQQGDESPFSSLLAATVQNRTLTGRDSVDLIRVASFYGAWESVLGVHPVVGRWFSAEEEKRGDQRRHCYQRCTVEPAIWRRQKRTRAIHASGSPEPHHRRNHARRFSIPVHGGCVDACDDGPAEH